MDCGTAEKNERAESDSTHTALRTANTTNQHFQHKHTLTDNVRPLAAMTRIYGLANTPPLEHLLIGDAVISAKRVQRRRKIGSSTRAEQRRQERARRKEQIRTHETPRDGLIHPLAPHYKTSFHILVQQTAGEKLWVRAQLHEKIPSTSAPILNALGLGRLGLVSSFLFLVFVCRCTLTAKSQRSTQAAGKAGS